MASQKQEQVTFNLTTLKDAHISSITCVDWSPALPNRIMSGSEDKFLKIWDIRSKKCGIALNLTKKGEITDITSFSYRLWAATSDCKVYEFDTRMIRQPKSISHFLQCHDEISQLHFDESCDALFIADDIGKVNKYNFGTKQTNSVCFHNNALCTSLSTIPELNIGFCGGTDAMLYQWDLNLQNAFSFSMMSMMKKTENQITESKEQYLNINPPFVYSLDAKLLSLPKKKGSIAIALGNGTIALYVPHLSDFTEVSQSNGDVKDNKENEVKVDDDGNDKNDDEEEEEEEEEEELNDALCCKQLHQSAVSDISFGYNNDWLVSAGTDKVLMINEWQLINESKMRLDIESKYKIQLKHKPNSMVCTGNNIAQIVVADVSNHLSMYAMKS